LALSLPVLITNNGSPARQALLYGFDQSSIRCRAYLLGADAALPRAAKAW
jgi:hypothetical protein